MPPKSETSTSFITKCRTSELYENRLLIQARRIYVVEGRYPKKCMQNELVDAGVDLPQPKYKKKEIEQIFFETFGAYFRRVAEERQQHRVERLQTTNHKFDYIIVIDFECTCKPAAKNLDLDSFEIIEFPVVLIDVNQRCIVDDYFHRYIKPVRNQVTAFCTKLTGITPQQIANHGVSLQSALLEFQNWLTAKGITDMRYAYAVDGQSDFGHFLQTSLKLNGLPFLHDFRRYIDVKHTFQQLGYSKKIVKLKRMLRTLDMRFEGQLHCGLDDTRNIAKVVLRMLHDGYSLDYTHKLVPQDMPTMNPELVCLDSKKVFYNRWMESSTLRPIVLTKTDLSKGRAEWCDICRNFLCKQNFSVALA
uniref:Exonuclease domain-containing protein n=1 Tax=Panagrellus redivivus TaxID=6233 RepID=A0A7E4W4J5_PANRE